MTAGRFVGQRVTRREDRRFTTGEGNYIDDIAVAGMVHAAFVRSDFARGIVQSIDTTEAEASPGVIAVLTAADLNAMSGPMYSTLLGEAAAAPPMRALAEGDVRYVGEPVAVVVARDRYLAEDAAELVFVDVEPQTPVIGPLAALDETDQIVHPERGTNLAQSFPVNDTPEVEAAFAGAAHVISRRFTQSRATCVPMEGRGLIASWSPSSQTFEGWVSSQNSHEYHAHMARVLDVPHHHVRLRTGDVGGGFGQKVMVTRDEDCIVLASKALAMPIKWIEDRRENLIAANQARAEVLDVSMALDEDANILACTVRHVEDVGAYAIGGHASASGNLANIFPGPYRIPLYGVGSRSAYTNTVGRGAYRGPWLSETTAREQMIDHVARELDIDPLELRRRNTITDDELPYTTATGMVYDNMALTGCLEQAVEMVDYEAFRAQQAAALEEGRYLGLGLSTYVEPGAISWGSLAAERAVLRIDPGGKVRLLLGSGEHGQSVGLTMSQLVAEYLGCGVDDVELIQGDTATTPFGGGTAGSRTSVIAGGATIGAAKVLRDKVASIAAHLLEAAPADIEVLDGRAFVAGSPAQGLSFAEIAHVAYRQTDQLAGGPEPDLEASHRYQPPNMFTFSNACHVCVCEVDIETGLVDLQRYIVSEDCGPLINPTVVEGQVSGGVVQGIGGVLYEHMAYDDDGNPLASTFLDYLLPGAAEMPIIEIGHCETLADTEGGFKGMSEGGTIGAPAAVANAVADALAPLGVQTGEFPLGPSQIIDLIEAAASASA